MLKRYPLYCLLASLVSALALAAGAAAQEPSDEVPLRLNLEAGAPLNELASLSELRVTLENIGADGLSVILPVDGSFDGMRSPSYRWLVVGPEGEALISQPRPRCGMVNPLLPDDVVALEPGQAADVASVWMAEPDAFFDFDRPGTYRIRLVYDVDPEGTMWGRLAVSPAANGLLADVWSGQVVSNEVALTLGLSELRRLPWNGPILTDVGAPIRIEDVAAPMVLPDAPSTLR